MLLSIIFISNNCTNPSFRAYAQKMHGLPTFRSLYQNNQISKARYTFGDVKEEWHTLRVPSFLEFEETLSEFIATSHAHLSHSQSWFKERNPLANGQNPYNNSFFAFVEKYIAPATTHFICKGDLHGDAHSLLAFLESMQKKGYTGPDNGFKITDPNVLYIFHGDYVDRGIYGVEVLYMLMQLKLQNPDRVYLIRGNHEDPLITAFYGFYREFNAKFADIPAEKRDACYKKITTFYNMLPLALYLGSGDDEINYIQCCHGGIELGYNPTKFLVAPSHQKYQWIKKCKQKKICQHLKDCTVTKKGKNYLLSELAQDYVPESLQYPHPIGLVWNDFCPLVQQISSYNPLRGYMFNKDFTNDYLQRINTQKIHLCGIIRAHQHTPDNNDPLMKLLLSNHGCAQLWQEKGTEISFNAYQGMVLTLLLSPDNITGTPACAGPYFTGFSYDTYLMGTVGKNFHDWKMTVCNNTIY